MSKGAPIGSVPTLVQAPQIIAPQIPVRDSTVRMTLVTLPLDSG
jgi:hypothetical protein